MRLGVNIDHIATVRQVRRGTEPNLLAAARECISGGAYGLTIHLREDRRHIQDADVIALKSSGFRLNLELSAASEIIEIACKVKPEACCLVPEKREELTTEGGLDVISGGDALKSVIQKLKETSIIVSVFIDPDQKQIQKAFEYGADCIEIHTGTYANLKDDPKRAAELNAISNAARFAGSLGLQVHAGHGIDYQNVGSIAAIKPIEELNIGHSIVSHALFVGLKEAVSQMSETIKKYAHK